MSGSIIPTPDYRAVDGQSFGTQVEKQRLGFIGLSLTNYDNNSVPQIAADSCIEISGSIFQFPSNDSITGTPSSGNINYIVLTVSGSGDSQIVTASWATGTPPTAPTWNTSKQGWYDATNAKRYVGGCYYAGGNYTDKWVYGILYKTKLYDKNNNELIATLVETKIKEDVGAGIPPNTVVNIDITGFSFTPDAVLNVSIAYWTTAGAGERVAATTSLFGSVASGSALKIIKATPGANKVTVRVANGYSDTFTFRYRMTCTAIKTS